ALGAAALPVAAQLTPVYVTTQRFDSGLMVWRADNGTIYVLSDSGRAFSYSITAYSSLPDNPIFGNPPSRLRPIFGFGKVWGNNASVRDLLGWPVLPEIGFNTTVLVQNATIFITELDGSVIQINHNGTWTRNGPVSSVTPTPVVCPHPFFFGMPTDDICPGAPVTTQAAYQPYERGFMIWLADAGDIWVFVNAPAPNRFATYAHFSESDYARFADAPPQPPPPGRFQPINGFGRVWHNLNNYLTGSTIRADLGWATAPESSYTATRQVWGRTSHVHVYLSLPDGRVADAYQGLAGINWTWAK
ncbi:MAG: hypothetical protein HZC41_03715, partial [Chloroflexi bacterium]|nr:hypothetical protein [Chloroflexota bacterium]